jgi:hypothetical protein
MSQQLSGHEADINQRFVGFVVEHAHQAERWEFAEGGSEIPVDHLEFSVRELLTGKADYDPRASLLHSIRLCADSVAIDQPLSFGARIPKDRLISDVAVEQFLGALHLADYGNRLPTIIEGYSPPSYAHQYAATVLLDRIQDWEATGIIVPAHRRLVTF